MTAPPFVCVVTVPVGVFVICCSGFIRQISYTWSRGEELVFRLDAGDARGFFLAGPSSLFTPSTLVREDAAAQHDLTY